MTKERAAELRRNAPQIRLVITPVSTLLRWDLIALRYSGRVVRSVCLHTGYGAPVEVLETERDCLVATWRALGELLWPEGGVPGFHGARLEDLQGLVEGPSEPS